MAMLSKEEKKELLRLSVSAQLRKDFRMIKMHSDISRKKGFLNNNMDFYLRFLTVSNAFANHKQKKFQKMKGENFRI